MRTISSIDRRLTELEAKKGENTRNIIIVEYENTEDQDKTGHIYECCKKSCDEETFENAISAAINIAGRPRKEDLGNILVITPEIARAVVEILRNQKINVVV